MGGIDWVKGGAVREAAVAVASMVVGRCESGCVWRVEEEVMMVELLSAQSTVQNVAFIDCTIRPVTIGGLGVAFPLFLSAQWANWRQLGVLTGLWNSTLTALGSSNLIVFVVLFVGTVTRK